ncbi:energy-coupling factor transporter transmembrane component T family protein [Tundrisphaera sp. TA3]|uniref:energy-coupling factor transporter transmembrane component T family protein n=1 Tax=Tundrisphaera sp. TA3 TaxID=3435775 RepID=UPI003EB8775D
MGLEIAGPGPLGRLDPRATLLATVAYVLAVVATPPGAWWALAVEAVALAVAIMAARVAPFGLVRRWLRFLPALLFLAVMVAPSHPARPLLGWGTVAAVIVLKNSLAFLAMMTLARVTPFRAILEAMGRLGMPTLLVSTLRFMERQVHILADDLRRMLLARRARSFRRPGRLDATMLGGLIGMLFIRSLERGERVHAAMLARGWDGTARTLDGADDR